MGIAYIFVAAAAIAVISISFIFKLSMDTIKEYPEEKESVQNKFFIWLGVSEVIPLILIVFGFMNLDTVATIEDLYIPGLFVIVLMGFAALFIILQRAVGVPKEIKMFVNTFSYIALGMANAIPIIALVSLLLMIP